MKIIEHSENVDKRTLYKLTKSGSLEKVKDHDGEQFTIVDYVLFTDDNSDGEEKTILSFVTADGECFGTNSATVIKSFLAMKEIFGLPIEDVAITSGQSKHGTRYFNLELI